MESQTFFIRDILKEMHLFSDLDQKAIEQLSTLFMEKVYNRGETIFEEGSIGNSMMIITSGEVRVTQKADTDTEEALIILKKGDFFGEMALLEDLPRSASAIAHANVIIFEISRQSFMNFIQKDYESGLKILLKLSKILSSRLRETDKKLKVFIDLSKWI